MLKRRDTRVDHDPGSVWQWAVFLDPQYPNDLASLVDLPSNPVPLAWVDTNFPRRKPDAQISTVYFTLHPTSNWWNKWTADLVENGWTVVPRHRQGHFAFTRGDRTVFIFHPCEDAWFPARSDRPNYQVECNRVFAAMARHLERLTTDVDRCGRSQYFPLRRTPARTGIELMRLFMPRQAVFETLEDHICDVIMGTWDTPAPPQNREEVFGLTGPNPTRGQPAGEGDWFYHYDYKGRYARCLTYGDKPIGEPLWITAENDKSPRYIPYRPAWYLVSAKVPDDWNHVGLVWANGHWPRTPGETFTTWVSEIEMRILVNIPHSRGGTWRGVDRDPAFPSIDQDWNVQVHERIEFCREGQRSNYLFSRWSTVLDRLEEETTVEKVDKALVAELLRHAVRAIRYHAVGALHSSPIATERMTPDQLDALPDDAVVKFSKPRGDTLYTVTRKTGADDVIAPQLAAWIWAEGRSYVTRTLLTMPIENLIGVYRDAVCTTRQMRYAVPAETAKRGQVRLKGGIIQGPYPLPTSIDDMLELITFATSGGQQGRYADAAD